MTHSVELWMRGGLCRVSGYVEAAEPDAGIMNDVFMAEEIEWLSPYRDPGPCLHDGTDANTFEWGYLSTLTVSEWKVLTQVFWDQMRWEDNKNYAIYEWWSDHRCPGPDCQLCMRDEPLDDGRARPQADNE